MVAALDRSTIVFSGSREKGEEPGPLAEALGIALQQINIMRDFGSTVLMSTPSYALNLADADLKRKALTAVAAKMARVAYGMIKKNVPYRQFFEQSLPSGSIPLSSAVGAPA